MILVITTFQANFHIFKFAQIANDVSSVTTLFCQLAVDLSYPSFAHFSTTLSI